MSAAEKEAYTPCNLQKASRRAFLERSAGKRRDFAIISFYQESAGGMRAQGFQ